MTEYDPNLTLNEILDIEGVVVRKIPMTTTTRWSNRDSEVKQNTLGGKYLVTLKHNQDSTVRFHKGYYGIGQTIQGAWCDLLTSKSYYLP
jgi:hypothetical protein